MEIISNCLMLDEESNLTARINSHECEEDVPLKPVLCQILIQKMQYKK